jgi:hypothetical protein
VAGRANDGPKAEIKGPAEQGSAQAASEAIQVMAMLKCRDQSKAKEYYQILHPIVDTAYIYLR